MVDINYSTKGKKCLGRWYRKTNSITVFLNNLAKIHNPENDFDNFISELSAIEFHELGHIIGFRNGCKGCNGMNCYYCQLTDCISYFLKDGRWSPAYSLWMKKIAFAIRMRKLPLEERLDLLTKSHEPRTKAQRGMNGTGNDSCGSRWAHENKRKP